MARTPVNIIASVKQRLLNLAREENRVFDVILVRYALERLLYRLSVSEHSGAFVLKGGMLVTLWISSTSSRETRDADFLGYGDADPERLRSVFTEILATDTGDGLIFDTRSLRIAAIRDEMEYGGVRLRVDAYLERSRIPVTIDIGFGDALIDAQTMAYPSMLGMEEPRIRTYPPAAVVAEKFQAMVALGIANGRMKDYFDLWALPRSLQIPPDELDAAISATFTRRRTAIPAKRPPGLSEAVFADGTKPTQWSAYADSLGLKDLSFEEVIEAAWTLVGPSCQRLQARDAESSNFIRTIRDTDRY